MFSAPPPSSTWFGDLSWGLLSDIEYNGVEVYVSFLRRKLAELGSGVSICSVRGMGYRLEAPEKDG